MNWLDIIMIFVVIAYFILFYSGLSAFLTGLLLIKSGKNLAIFGQKKWALVKSKVGRAVFRVYPKGYMAKKSGLLVKFF